MDDNGLLLFVHELESMKLQDALTKDFQWIMMVVEDNLTCRIIALYDKIKMKYQTISGSGLSYIAVHCKPDIITVSVFHG